jgi:rhodanese-related sulfurtransferase
VAITDVQRGATVAETDPASSFKALEADPDILLIDVRTRAEWAFVGAPDLSGIGKRLILIEWRRFPTMEINTSFIDEVDQAVGAAGVEPKELHFICRSGARSMEAAQSVAKAWSAIGRSVMCVNVAEGFEGDLDVQGRRGGKNGWKARGLPWRQN